MVSEAFVGEDERVPFGEFCRCSSPTLRGRRPWALQRADAWTWRGAVRGRGRGGWELVYTAGVHGTGRGACAEDVEQSVDSDESGDSGDDDTEDGEERA